MNTPQFSLFPHILIRMGGSSYDALESMKQPDLLQRLSELADFEQTQDFQKAVLCEELLEFIRMLDNAQVQNQVQNLRRDLYNDRKIKSGKLRKALQWMPEKLQTSVQRYLNGKKEGQRLREQVHQQYEQQLLLGRNILQQLSQEAALQKGLVLSSQSFLQKLPSYRCKSPQDFVKKDFRTEQSLLKYLTRIKAKTSPFSTFNNLCLAEVVPTAAPLQIRSTGSSQVIGHTRLNNQLFRYLRGLLAHFPPIRQHLLLRVNPTITVADNQYTYLTNHYNVEAFQRLPQHPVVELILELCKAEPGGIIYQDVLKEITDYVDATAEDLEQYIGQLIDYGFLEYDFTVSGIDPNWDEQLVKLLQPLAESEVPFAGDLIAVLQDIRAKAEQYSEAEVDDRQTLLTQAYDAFREVCMRLHEAARLPAEERLTYEERLALYRKKQHAMQPQTATEAVAVVEPPTAPPEKQSFQHREATMFFFKPEQMFYEDTTRPLAVTIGNQPLRQWVAEVEKLLRALPLFRGHYEERMKMKHYFLEQYTSDAVVPLLQFYEHYYRDVKKVEAEKAAQSRPSEEKADTPSSGASEDSSVTNTTLSSIPELEQQRSEVLAWNKALTEQLQSKARLPQDIVNISYEDIAAANRTLSIPNAPVTSNSYGAFVQFYQENNQTGQPSLKGVVNALFPGYGRMISRFLHILPYQVTEEVRSWNQQLQGSQSLLIEDCDASYFNANLHPPLLPQEVRMPGGHNSLPASQQIPITDFVVRYDTEDDALQLIHQSSDKLAYVLDLGFQGQQGRSPLFQLLEKFTKAEYRYTRPVEQVVNQLCSPPEETRNSIRVYPRIIYQDQVVLQRKTWVVPYEQIPLHQPQETDAQYYYRINHWRQEQGLPEDVFVTLNPHRLGEVKAQKPAAKLSRDDYKPQYINFANPLLVGLLEKLLIKEPPLLVLVEMLPRGDQMLSLDQQKYVTEYVVQWYTEAQSTINS